MLGDRDERTSPHATSMGIRGDPSTIMSNRMLPPGPPPTPTAPTMAPNLAPPAPAEFSSATAASATSPAHAFIKLCLLWTALHRTTKLPPACQGALSDQNLSQIHNIDDIIRHINAGSDGAIFMVNKDKVDRGDNSAHYVKRRPNYERTDNHMKYHYRYTTRSLSVIAVLAGIVFILFVVAITTCIRNRRSIMLDYYQNPSGNPDSFTRQILIDHLRHLSSSRRGNASRSTEPPPNYEEVVKKTEEEDLEGANEELPSYVEAMENQERLDAQHEQENNASVSSPSRSRRNNTTNTSLSNDNCALRKTSMVAIQHQMAMPSISEETATVHKSPSEENKPSEDEESKSHVITVVVEEPNEKK